MATTKNTGSKTPYEIRLELLQMAQEHLQTTYDRQMQFATEALKLAQDAQWKSLDELKKLMPVPFTFDEIVAKASELYGFVQKKD